MALWLLRNYLAYGVLTGNRRQVDYALPELLWDAVAIMWGWLVDFDRPLTAWANLALLAVIVAVALPLGYGCIRERGLKGSEAVWRSLGIFGGFALVYLGLLLAAMMLGNTWHGVQRRFLIPLYVPCLVVVAALALDRLLVYARERERRQQGKAMSWPIIGTITGKNIRIRTAGLPALILMLALGLGLAGQIPYNASRIIQANSGDPDTVKLGYSGPRWVGSETLGYIRENPISGTVYSNVPIMAYFNNGGTAMGEPQLIAACRCTAPAGTLLIREMRRPLPGRSSWRRGWPGRRTGPGWSGSTTRPTTITGRPTCTPRRRWRPWRRGRMA